MTNPPNSENEQTPGNASEPGNSAQPAQAPVPNPDAPQPPQAAPAAPPAAPQYPTPQAPAPQYAQPQYAQPQYVQQPYAQQQYGQPQYGAPGSYGVPGPGGVFDGAFSADVLTRPLYGATFGQAVRRFFKNYANFSGRASRSEYWFVELFMFLVWIIPGIFYFIGLITFAVSASTRSYDYEYGYSSGAASGAGAGIGMVMLIIAGILAFAIVCATIVPLLAISWRRLHDANMAGPFYFLSCIPYAGGIIQIILMVMGSKPEGRRFDR